LGVGGLVSAAPRGLSSAANKAVRRQQVEALRSDSPSPMPGIEWDAAYVDQVDEVPPGPLVLTCRPCLNTGVMLERSVEGIKFTSGCDHCGRNVKAVDE
jgi:hypothetical protein